MSSSYIGTGSLTTYNRLSTLQGYKQPSLTIAALSWSVRTTFISFGILPPGAHLKLKGQRIRVGPRRYAAKLGEARQVVSGRAGSGIVRQLACCVSRTETYSLTSAGNEGWELVAITVNNITYLTRAVANAKRATRPSNL